MTPATCLAALVLLIDTSGSVPDHLYAAQRDGTALAFETPQLFRAMEQDGGVAVTVADFSVSTLVRLRWTMIRNATEAGRFAAAFRTLERSGRHDTTAIGRAVADAHRESATVPCLPQLKVIDISTDGQETISLVQAREARDAAAAEGIIINAVAFGPRSGEFSAIDSASLLTETASWLRENVATGFVRIAVEEDGFLEAFRNKLVTEVTALHSVAE
ncbi:DUF1194 domain-containing protein [Falsiroseomonas sp. E2-1-a20]|uniref:DUF1194 domain-containing protein n=1 Tax=Falsiroseomonas sp. E2-1-a20 TaxID=3239300 RepID=UPI003F3E7953